MNGLILTGMSGFIGLNFLKLFTTDRSFRSRYQAVLSIDKMGYATKYNDYVYNSICKQNDIIKIDKNINDISGMRSVYDPTTYTSDYFKWDILDFASESHVDNSIKNPSAIFTENSSTTAKLVEYVGGPTKINRFNHISTDEVYGDIDTHAVKSGKSHYFNHKSPLKPSNPYAASKVAQDMFLYSMVHTFGMKVSIIRMANQFGLYQHPEKMIPATINRIIKGETAKVYGTGQNIRQWTWAGDTVKCINNILDSPMVHSGLQIYHIADERNLFDNNYITDKIIELMNKKGYEGKKEYIEDRKGHDRAYALVSDFNNYDIEFDKRLEEVVNWYIEKKEIYGK